MEFRGIMGGFYRISEWIMRLSVINVLWIICALPFFFIGLMLLQTDSVDQLLSTLILLAIVSPFTLFPSTAAMFSVARKWLTGEEDAPLFKTFFRGYKENFVQAMLGGFIYTLIAVVLYTNFKYYGSQTGSLGVLRFLVLTLTVLISVSFFHFFSILSHLHMKMFQIIKNAVLISIGHPVRSITMIICNGFVIYISFSTFTFLIPFFMGSLIAVITFWHFNLIFGKLQSKQQEIADKEAEEAEKKQLEAGENGSTTEDKFPSSSTQMHQSSEDGNTRNEKP
ncbi:MULTISPECIES: YesL family protein [unclassified Paenibacillus]|uniref:YesL family protein n=1 Tax=unclassified Paenibacillus TaxID=185978 RepID=UPI0036372FE0